MMSLDALHRHAVDLARNRFDVLPVDESLADLLALNTPDPSGADHTRPLAHRILQLRRSGRPEAGRRTLLMAALEDAQPLSDALRWAANVRDRLTNEEAADLYLILLIPGLDPQDVPRIESDESFCRKYAAPSVADPGEFLQRTFLGRRHGEGGTDRPSEPLAAALQATAADRTWLDEARLEAWRSVLLSSDDGPTLAQRLVQPMTSEVP
jgi:hypothetical protein